MGTEAEVKEEPKVDLNALSAPEGTAPENFDNFVAQEVKLSESTSKLYNLPNLDPTPEVKTEGEEEVKVVPESVAPIKPIEVIPEKPADATAPWYHKPFKDLQKKLELTDEEFKLPEGLTEENYLDKYNEFLYENTEFDDNIHPELKKINDLVSKGVDFNEALGAYQRMNNLEKLSDKELVSLSLKQQFGKTEERKDGWDEDKINERITKMDNSGYLEIEAQRLRDQIANEKNNINTRYEESIKTQNEKRNSEFETKRTEQINRSLEFLSGMKDVYGIPVSKAELAEFKEDFKYLVTPNEKGMAPITEFLQSNENLVKFAYFLKKGDAKIREALTKAKENAKQSIIDKLDDEPKLPKKIANSRSEGAIDLDALSREAKD